ncbi:glycosyltransferase [Noviherbaspirillum sp. ST9]|uniref:glycosyltransferase n=1 Tax=Noviherbaspirillum sp. ST9 TaxID=3401606 RepID=UPI003B58A76D
MRIVFDLQACQASNRHRGIGRYSLSLALEMVRQAAGHDVRVVLNGRFPESIAPLRAAFDGLLPREHIAVFDVPAPIAGIDPGNAWRTRAAERVRDAFLAGFRPDMVHTSSLFEGLVDDAVTSIDTLQGMATSAATLYDLIPLMRKEAYLQDARVRDWYYRKLQSLKNADLLLAISAHSRQEAIDALYLPAERVVNISGAVDASFRPLTLSADARQALMHRYGLNRPFLMYTGGIDNRKNIEGLIAAFARLPTELRRARQLAIVCKADDADKRRLLDLASKAGLNGDEVVFTGFVPDADLIAMYSTCELFVFPSLHEGFGLPALEAMSCGAAVIGSDSSSIPEVIGREDALFDATDATAIARKMQQALADDAFLASLKEHGAAQAMKFSWEASARTALDALESAHDQAQARRVTRVPVSARPRLAYLSPLPPDKSGIADYSAELLPELARYYDIEVITDQETITDPMVAANFPRRSVAWFDAHATRYDRIVYHFGNSSFHQHMFELLERHPGVVVLHDFFLSGILAHMDGNRFRPYAFPVALYQSHGYPALLEDKTGRGGAIWTYPCNKTVIDLADGVIVHSQYSKVLARQWYKADTADQWRTIPLLRAFPVQIDRSAARKRLGIWEEEFVVCAFGILGPTKLNDRLLHAWLVSPLAEGKRCHLVFVGQCDSSPYGRELQATLARAKAKHGDRVRITGFVSQEDYRNYLAAADIAVQLRSMSRGETSASILDCLAYGIPTIINANGSGAELPDDVLVKLDDEFDNDALTQALASLWKDTARRTELSQRAIDFVRSEHHPVHVGQMYFEAIEDFAADPARVAYRSLMTALAREDSQEEDFRDIAECVAANRPATNVRQMFVDISELVQRDARSGIQRVVRNILTSLLKDAPAGYRVEPVYEKDGVYQYAREFTLRMLELAPAPIPDDPIEPQCGDIFLGLDLNPAKIPDNEATLAKLRDRGVDIHFVVYDLLPVLRPDVFVPGAKDGFSRWLQAVTRLADGLVCISRAVADELAAWIRIEAPSRLSTLKIGYFHLGADIASELRKDEREDKEDARIAPIKERPSLLMVGTLEPRKGHAQALAAFEALWKQGVDANLVIVGKQGWMVDDLVERLRNHPESGKHLFWFEGASDATLLDLYTHSAALLAASEAEGFGLPLIEAAQHGLPVIARDIPVFREVAGEHASYFSAQDAAELAAALRSWLQVHAGGTAVQSKNMLWLTWAQSAGQLMDNVLHGRWYLDLPPANG